MQAIALKKAQTARAQQMLATADPARAARNRVIVIVPSSDRPVVELPARRIARFRHRLMQMITRAAMRRWGRAEADSETDGYPEVVPELTATETRLMAHACSTCRGHCCQQGGEHAFLHPHAILKYWQHHPDHRPADVLEAYLARLPRRSVRGSCVYHGRDGCTLEPFMISHICKRFICRGAAELINTTEEPGAVAVAAADGNVVRRVAPLPEAESRSSAPAARTP